MNALDIVNNPHAIVTLKIATLAGNQHFGGQLTGSGQQYSIDAAKAKCSVSAQTPSLTCTSDAGGVARFLPYKENANCRITLDAGARLFITGQLSGCNVYIDASGINPTICHANSNANADDIAENNSAKLDLAQEVLGQITFKIERTAYKGKFTGGIVFGVRERAGWKFYVYGLREPDFASFVVPISVFSYGTR